MAWEAEFERITTLLGLIQRKVNVVSSLYPLCSWLPEMAEHLSFSCYFANMLWCFVSSWCKIPQIFAFTVRDLLLIHDSASSSQTTKQLIQAVILNGIWSLWKMRNAVVFRNARPSISFLLEEVKTSSYQE